MSVAWQTGHIGRRLSQPARVPAARPAASYHRGVGISADETRARIGVLRGQAAAEQCLAAEAGGDHQARAVHALAAEIAGLRADGLEAWLRAGDPGVPRPRMVDVLAGVLGTPSVAAVLWFGPDGQWTRLSASDPDGQAACEAEMLTGEGPATRAWRTGRPCAASAAEVAGRWPLYAAATAGLGPAAVSAAPLGPEESPLGAICARYPDGAGPEQVSVAAAAVTRLLLYQAGNIGQLLARDTSLTAVHRAAGLIAAQAGCTTSEAHSLLAAFAFASDIPLAEAAGAVLNGDITLGQGQAGGQAPGREDKPG